MWQICAKLWRKFNIIVLSAPYLEGCCYLKYIHFQSVHKTAIRYILPSDFSIGLHRQILTILLANH